MRSGREIKIKGHLFLYIHVPVIVLLKGTAIDFLVQSLGDGDSEGRGRVQKLPITPTATVTLETLRLQSPLPPMPSPLPLI